MTNVGAIHELPLRNKPIKKIIMSNYPAKHHRKSIRLPGYDYSSPGYYFITICIHDRWIQLFGNVENGQMLLNNYGIIANDWIVKIPKRFPNTIVDSFVVMPNHIHLIIQILYNDHRVVVGAIHELPLRRETYNETYRKKRRVMTIPKIIGYYRMNTAERINTIRQTSGNPIWQRNYWEHIVRNENELLRIRQYIKNNPVNWKCDKLNDSIKNRVSEESAPYGEPASFPASMPVSISDSISNNIHESIYDNVETIMDTYKEPLQASLHYGKEPWMI